jgi:hypothetical protein
MMSSLGEVKSFMVLRKELSAREADMGFGGRG